MLWRDLPSEFEYWNAVYKRFNRWAHKQGFLEILTQLAHIADQEWVFADGTIIRAHQHSTGTATGSSEAIGKSRGGIRLKYILLLMVLDYLTTKNSVRGSGILSRMPKV